MPQKKIDSDVSKLIEIASRKDAKGLAMCYDLVFGDRGWTFPAHLAPVADALADERISNLMVIMTPGSGKSQLVSVLYPAWLLAHDLNQTIMGISGAEDLIIGFVKSTMDLIEHSDNYRMIFPHVKPDKKMGWSSSGFFVEGRAAGTPDASYSPFGVLSKALTGKHARTIILDDPHTADNTTTDLQIEKVCNLYYNTILGRQDPKGARMIVAGRRWAHNDLYSKLGKSNEYVTIFLPAWRFDNLEDRRLYCDVFVPKGLKCVFSERAGSDGRLKVYYSMADTDKRGKFFWPNNEFKKNESWQVKKSSRSLFEAIYQGDPRLEENRLFEPRDFRFRHGLSFASAMEMASNNKATMIQAWDTAVSTNKHSDYSAVATALLVPCEAIHPAEKDFGISNKKFHYDVFMLNVMRHKWDFKDLIKNVRYFYKKYLPSLVLMENKASGDPLISLLKDEVPLYPVSDGGKSKTSRIVGLGTGASAQGWIRMGHVFWPKDAEWLEATISEFVEFSPENTHRADDRVDAVIYLINHALVLAGSGNLAISDVFLEQLAQDEEETSKYSKMSSGVGLNSNTKDALTLSTLVLRSEESLNQSPDIINKMFLGACKTCRNFVLKDSWCSLHNHKTTIFSTCDDYKSMWDKNVIQMNMETFDISKFSSESQDSDDDTPPNQE